MFLKLGTRPLGSGIATIAPVALAIILFWALMVSTVYLPGFVLASVAGIMFALTAITMFLGYSFWPAAAQTFGALMCAAGYAAYLGAHLQIAVWLVLSFMLAALSASAARERDRTVGRVSKFFFDLFVFQSLYWSVYLMNWTYSPEGTPYFTKQVLGITIRLGGNAYWSYGPPLVALILCMGIAWRWSKKAQKRIDAD